MSEMITLLKLQKIDNIEPSQQSSDRSIQKHSQHRTDISKARRVPLTIYILASLNVKETIAAENRSYKNTGFS